MKYKKGDTFYMKSNYYSFFENERITIVNVRKCGKKTYVDISNINNEMIKNVSVKRLRKRPRKTL